MKPQIQHDLEILTAIAEGRPLTQRDLAQRLGVALGLANLYLRRLARKGFIKIAQFPSKPGARKRLRYLLTPTGIAEKSRLTYEHVAYSLSLYRRARQTLREALSLLSESGMKRIALYGTGEAAELAYLTWKELGLEPVGAFDREANSQFPGLPVRGMHELLRKDFDGLIIATFDRPKPLAAKLTALGLRREKLLPLRKMASPAGGDGAAE